MNRRNILKSASQMALLGSPLSALARSSLVRPKYNGPNVVIFRFGGGVRRQEVLYKENTYSPYFFHELLPKGTLFNNMEIEDFKGVDTSHGQGTLNILTGHYDQYEDFRGRALGARFVTKKPTLFEYLRKNFDLRPHETLIVNGEDRKDEEYYNYSAHKDFGRDYQSVTLSLNRYKDYLYDKILQEQKLSDKELKEISEKLKEIRDEDYHHLKLEDTNYTLYFWQRWRKLYGDSGFKNARGDRLLTDLTIQAMKWLRPRAMIINYNDPDYVHWGLPAHYYQGIRIIDQGFKQVIEYCQLDPFYRGQTLFVMVPDCGRNDNKFQSVPFQHHFNSHDSRQIFAFFMGPGVAKNKIRADKCSQIDVLSTVAQLMGFRPQHAEGNILDVG